MLPPTAPSLLRLPRSFRQEKPHTSTNFEGPVVVVLEADFRPSYLDCHFSLMTHIAIQENLDGKVVDRMEHVSDAQYEAGKQS